MSTYGYGKAIYVDSLVFEFLSNEEARTCRAFYALKSRNIFFDDVFKLSEVVNIPKKRLSAGTPFDLTH